MADDHFPYGNFGSRPPILDKTISDMRSPAYAATLLSIRQTSSIGEVHNTFQLDHDWATDK